MLQRKELTDDQKKAVLKAFHKSETMKNLVTEFKKSFKALELREDVNEDYPELENHDNDHYVIWSSVLSKTLRIPVKEIM